MGVHEGSQRIAVINTLVRQLLCTQSDHYQDNNRNNQHNQGVPVTYLLAVRKVQRLDIALDTRDHLGPGVGSFGHVPSGVRGVGQPLTEQCSGMEQLSGETLWDALLNAFVRVLTHVPSSARTPHSHMCRPSPTGCQQVKA